MRAHEQAAAAGDGWVGPPHIVLALLEDDSVAARVLTGLGLDREGARRRLPGGSKPKPGAGGFENPALHKLYGVATGLALADGASDPAPEHWLIALAYDARDREGTTLHLFGLDPAQVMEALRLHGVRVPALAPPVHIPWRGGHRIIVSAARLQPVLDRLRAEHPAGSEWRWGWNWVDDDMSRAVITAEDGVDLGACAGGSGSGGRPSAPAGSPGSRAAGTAGGSPPTDAR